MQRRKFVKAGIAFGLAGNLFGAKEERSPLQVGVIGHTGRGDYGHGLDTMWLGIPGVEVVAVADPDPTGLEKASQRLGGVRQFSDYRKMLGEIKPDIVSVAPRWVDQHAEMVIAAAESGASGVYIEKPFSRSLAESDAMLDACEKAGVKLAVAHRNRMHPVLAVIKDSIGKGSIGKVLEMRGRGKEDPRGGLLDAWVLGSHIFNLMNFFAGRALECDAEARLLGKSVKKSDLKEGAEGIPLLGADEVHARFRMENGWTAHFDSIKNSGVGVTGFALEILGTKGKFHLRIDREPLAFYKAGNPFDTNPKGSNWQPVSTAGIGLPEPIENLEKLVASHYLGGMDLVESIRENREPVCNAREGRMTIEMLELVYNSIDK